MDKEDKYYKELFYRDIADKIKYRKPLNPDNNIAFNNRIPVRFKTKGYLLNKEGRKFFDESLTFLEAIQVWALVPKTDPLPFVLFSTGNIIINFKDQVNYSVYQRAIPGFSYSEKSIKKLNQDKVDITVHKEYPFEVIPEGQVRYDVYSAGIHIGTISVDKEKRRIEVSSLLSSWTAVAFKNKNIANKDFNLLDSVYKDYITGMFKGEIKDVQSTISLYPVKFSKKVKQVLKAVTARRILKDLER
jgi:hypothetical protein